MRLNVRVFLAVMLAFCLCLPSIAADPPKSIHVERFNQEVHTPYTEAEGLPSGDVLAVAYCHQGLIAATTEGVVRLIDGTWQPVDGLEDAIVLALAPSGRALYAPTGESVFRVSDGAVETIVKSAPAPITALAFGGRSLYVGTEEGLYAKHGSKLKPVKPLNAMLGAHPAIRGIAVHKDEMAVAAVGGLFVGDGKTWHAVLPRDGEERWAPEDIRCVVYDTQGRLWFACPQGVGCRQAGGQWKLYTGADGLPYNDFTSIAAGEDGSVWFGTKIGAIKWLDGVWSYREGRRWLIDNNVRGVAVSPSGDAWFATAGGVSRIEARPMTLAEKAAFYEDEIDRHNRRTPFGYVVGAALDAPGDKSTATAGATDNDGQYTGLYVGAECLAYAATGDPKFKKRATQVFEALAFMSEVTQGGTHPAPPGFITRAIMPTSGWNPNERDNAERDRKKQEGDRLWKILEPRWPISEDGKWYWKTDTSSDELDGHYFAYGLYYDHVAETEIEKARCREVVRRVTDHLIEHDYRLVDHDGQPTRWARFSPKDLNDDSSWWTERGLNSLSVLTYLSVAHHVTGDQKYRDAYMTLVRDHHYALNGMCMPKLQSGPGSFVQFDDKMAFMNFYHLTRYETDPELLNMYYTSMFYYWHIEKYELNPFFNFAYAACCLGKIRVDQWGDLDVSPTGEWLEQSVDTLLRYPIDLLDWRMINGHRTDIVPLPDHVREPGKNKDKGYRVSRYVMPIDERQALSWSEDAWALTTGGNGRRLRDGCPFLLAYYMGLYHGYITE
jgi:hypothetical protein